MVSLSEFQRSVLLVDHERVDQVAVMTAQVLTFTLVLASHGDYVAALTCLIFFSWLATCLLKIWTQPTVRLKDHLTRNRELRQHFDEICPPCTIGEDLFIQKLPLGLDDPCIVCCEPKAIGVAC